MKYQHIDDTKKAYPINLMCEVLQVSYNGYYHWLARPFNKRTEENRKLIPLVLQIHKESGGTYGTRRIAKALQARAVPCGRSRARTLMRQGFSDSAIARRVGLDRRTVKKYLENKEFLTFTYNL